MFLVGPLRQNDGVPGPYTWMNGRIVDAHAATVPFMTPALHLGIAVFEGIRCYETPTGPAAFRLHEHVARLLASAKILGFREMPWRHEELVSAIVELVAINGFSSCYVRPVIYLAEGGWDLVIDGGRPHCGIAAYEWKDYLGPAAKANGVRANVSSYARHHVNVMMTKAKASGNYINSMLAKTESRRLGFDEAILLDPQGFVAECSGENIFIVERGRILTPPAATVLSGITRSTVFELAASLGREVVEVQLSRDQLYAAEEVFVCGTAAEVVALREIDFRVVGDGRPGPVTRAVEEAYAAARTGRHALSGKWLTHVRRTPS
jgi:branched-chain amino acid aminotransferase